MFSAFLAILLLLSLIAYLKEHQGQQQRAKTQSSLPREQLLPHHYLCFVIVENRLWASASENERAKWLSGNLRLRTFEAELVSQFVQGLRQDFAQANRIFSVVIGRSPTARILTQLDVHRIKISLPYYFFSTLVRLRLLTDRVSLKELRQLANAVSSMAYEVRLVLDALEFSGHGDFVEALLRKS